MVSSREVVDLPTLLVEVFSPSTESYDRGEKLQNYREIPSLREVLHVATRERYDAWVKGQGKDKS